MKVTQLTKGQRAILYKFNAEVQAAYDRCYSELEKTGLEETQVRSLLALELDEI